MRKNTPKKAPASKVPQMTTVIFEKSPPFPGKKMPPFRGIHAALHVTQKERANQAAEELYKYSRGFLGRLTAKVKSPVSAHDICRSICSVEGFEFMRTYPEGFSHEMAVEAAKTFTRLYTALQTAGIGNFNPQMLAVSEFQKSLSSSDAKSGKVIFPKNFFTEARRTLFLLLSREIGEARAREYEKEMREYVVKLHSNQLRRIEGQEFGWN